jgi:hypothetical protein
MNIPFGRRFSLAAALIFLGLSPTRLWPGGLGEHQPESPSYFGFVKDAGGKTISDAKVKADIKGRAALMVRTDALGLYRIPRLIEEIGPNDVTISCSKEGYQQIRTYNRTRQRVKPPIRIECIMKRVAGR